MDRDSDVDVIEGLGNTTIKSKSLDGSNDEADDGAPFNKSVGSPPRPTRIQNNPVAASANFMRRPPGKQGFEEDRDPIIGASLSRPRNVIEIAIEQ